MRLTVAETRELIGWVLSFGSGVRVIGPDTLHRAVREEARKIVASKEPEGGIRRRRKQIGFDPICHDSNGCFLTSGVKNRLKIAGMWSRAGLCVQVT